MGIGQIAQACKVNYSLAYLSIRSNHIGVEGARYLANNISLNPTLKVLELYDTHLGSAGANIIATAVSANPVLEELDMSANQIDDSAAGKISEMIAKNKNLSTLNLAENDIGDKGGQLYADALNININLTLDLRSNQMGESSFALLKNHEARVQMTYNNFVSINKPDSPPQDSTHLPVHTKTKLTLWNRFSRRHHQNQVLPVSTSDIKPTAKTIHPKATA